MPIESGISVLSALLSASAAAPYARPERVAPSTFYDLDYRVCIVACCFEVHAKQDETLHKKLLSAKLKLLQFIAIRSWLLPVVQEWSKSRNDPQCSVWSSQSLRRGFLGDAMHDEVIDYLVAAGLMMKAQNHLATSNADLRLNSLYTEILSSELFAVERKTIHELRNVTITNAMLEGW